MTVFERTKKISKLRGFSLQKTAEKAGLSQNAIYNWKTKEPSNVSLKAVATVLGVSTDYLLGNTDSIEPKKDESNQKVDIADDTLIMAFDGKPIPDEEREKLLDYARYIMSQKKEK
ncbi:helix-turn-helix domain-containing protein [Fructobacillus fructosus]|uniref:helix-turn-helix domain-containing protein n=1 Tax=Fructobacillus fructosus TaxID=1631 RepID=UPI002DAE2372|nr:Transcriptional regulator [Fructobacillus fructosus]CAK1247797.1 Transcriptional regulator [Fructobacillus fructosus]CAK1247798.1 Transcriptional regulator [Fructobacillus fructosus]